MTKPVRHHPSIWEDPNRDTAYAIGAIVAAFLLMILVMLFIPAEELATVCPCR